MHRLHPIFNVVKLSLAPLNPIPGHRISPPPLPEIMDGEEEWVVEEILDSPDLSFPSDSLHSSFVSTSGTALGWTSRHFDFSGHPINFQIVLS